MKPKNIFLTFIIIGMMLGQETVLAKQSSQAHTSEVSSNPLQAQIGKMNKSNLL